MIANVLVRNAWYVAGLSQEFILQFPSDKRRQRLGKGFPLVPAVAPDAVVGTIEASARWITDSLLPFCQRLRTIGGYSSLGGVSAAGWSSASIGHLREISTVAGG